MEVHLFCPQPARRLSSTDVFWTCLRVPVDKFRPLELPACWRELWGSRNWLAARADVFPVACWSPLNKRRGWGKNDEKWGKGQFAFEKLFDRTVWWSNPPQLQTTWFSGSAQAAGKYVRLSLELQTSCMQALFKPETCEWGRTWHSRSMPIWGYSGYFWLIICL